MYSLKFINTSHACGMLKYMNIKLNLLNCDTMFLNKTCLEQNITAKYAQPKVNKRFCPLNCKNYSGIIL
jgi:hypothetical protein